MPLDETGWEELQSPGKHYIEDFLQEKYPKAYSVQELMKKFGKSQVAIHIQVNRLFFAGKLDRKKDKNKYYYRYKK